MIGRQLWNRVPASQQSNIVLMTGETMSADSPAKRLEQIRRVWPGLHRNTQAEIVAYAESVAMELTPSAE